MKPELELRFQDKTVNLSIAIIFSPALSPMMRPVSRMRVIARAHSTLQQHLFF